jgi:putative membrane protein
MLIILINWLISAIAVLIASYLIPGVVVSTFWWALVVALVLGIVNAVIKPILVLLTLPINILTLGLFTLVIDAVLVLLVSAIVPGFHVSGFWPALFFSITLSIINLLFGLL